MGLDLRSRLKENVYTSEHQDLCLRQNWNLDLEGPISSFVHPPKTTNNYPKLELEKPVPGREVLPLIPV